MHSTIGAFYRSARHAAKGCFMGTALLATSVAVANSAAAAEMNWRQFEGTTITWTYDIHPYEIGRAHV